MKFIDTHTHLYSSQFDEDRELVVKDAISNGVEKLLLPNISSKYSESLLNLCRKFPENCFPMMGLHPCDVTKENFEEEIHHVENELKKNKYIAVGEIGIDLYWDKSTIEIQKKAFTHQINLAKQYNIPIAIHVRESFDEAFRIVESLNDSNLTGVFHCFTGNENDAKKIIDLNGFYLGIGGVLTFKNSGLDHTIKNINLEHLLLETDSPYLAPTPYRGKRNESKYLLNIAKKIAEIHHVSIEEVAKTTTKNAHDLFNLKNN